MSVPQNYQTHRHRPTLTNVAGLFAFLGLLIIAIELFRAPSLAIVGQLCLAVAALVLVAASRIYTVRLQDRIIRLEMRLRLAGLLQNRQADIERLAVRQLIALRFASDAELPALMDRALAENLTSDQIKRAVRNWQADYQRT
jgi:hypothetical protein